MRVAKTSERVTIELTLAETERLRLALRRAMFEDIPQDRQRDVLDLAALLLEQLGGGA